MKCPSYQPTVPINYRLEENITRSFVFNDAAVELKAVFPEESKCSGVFCDRQNCVANNKSSKACGCYSNQNRLSSLVLCYDLLLRYGTDRGKEMNIENFTSLKFSKLFLDHDLPLSLTCNRLDNTEESFNLEDSIDSVLQYINETGGFTVVGWYKRGEIVDVSKDSKNQEDRVLASEITYHAVAFKPTYPILLNEDILRERRYRVSQLETVESVE